MDPMTAMMALSAFQTLQQGQKDKSARTLAAAQTRYSPWTGFNGGTPAVTQDAVGNFGKAYFGSQAQAEENKDREAWRGWLNRGSNPWKSSVPSPMFDPETGGHR